MGLLIWMEAVGKYANTSDRYCEYDGYSHPDGMDWKFVNISNRYCEFVGYSHLDGSGWKICQLL